MGASGAIFGVLVAFGVLYPDQTVLMFFLFPIKAKYMVMIYAGDRIALYPRPQYGREQHCAPGRDGVRIPVPQAPSAGSPAARAGPRGAYNRWRMARAKKKFQVYMRKRDGRGPWVN